jgi:bidirectional [NiFe] hydrogenase diaphorase subunit
MPERYAEEKMIRLTINDQELTIPEGRTLLEACREHGIYIPTLCYHPALEPFGACRLCMVEVSFPPRPPRIVASCVTPCETGMQVYTDTPAVRKSRKMTAELMLSEAHNSTELQLIARNLGVDTLRYQAPSDDDCILCGLCVRACKEIVGVSAITTIYRGFSKQVSPPFQIESSTCIGCGTCVLVCPTNAIKLEDISEFANNRYDPQNIMRADEILVDDSPGVYRALRKRQLQPGSNGHGNNA